MSNNDRRKRNAHRQSRYDQMRLARRQRQLMEILSGDQTSIQELKERRPESSDKLEILSVFEQGVAMNDVVAILDTVQNPTFTYNDPDRGYGYSEYQNEFHPSWSFASEWDDADTMGASWNAPQGQMAHNSEWPGSDDDSVRVGYDPDELEALGCVACWPFLGISDGQSTFRDAVGGMDFVSNGAGSASSGPALAGQPSFSNPTTNCSTPAISGTPLGNALTGFGVTFAMWYRPLLNTLNWPNYFHWPVQQSDGGFRGAVVSQVNDNPGTAYIAFFPEDATAPVNYGGNQSYGTRSTTSPTIDEWHFYAVTQDTDAVIEYRDGQFLSSLTNTTVINSLAPPSDTFNLHTDAPRQQGPAMVFDRALSEDEITELYWDTNPAANSRMLVQHESFDDYIKPVLFTDHDLNGGRIDMKVNGSPNSSPDGANTEQLDFELTDDQFYDLNWERDHKYVRINFSMAPSPDKTQTPVLRSFNFSTP